VSTAERRPGDENFPNRSPMAAPARDEPCPALVNCWTAIDPNMSLTKRRRLTVESPLPYAYPNCPVCVFSSLHAPTRRRTARPSGEFLSAVVERIDELRRGSPSLYGDARPGDANWPDVCGFHPQLVTTFPSLSNFP